MLCVTLCHSNTFDLTLDPLAFRVLRLGPHCSLVLNHTVLLKFAVAVIMIAATIFDQHGNGFVSVYPLDSARLRRHPTSRGQELLRSAAISGVSASVSDALQFHVFLQHSLLPNCHCRCVSEHRSSSLGDVIEFPSSCTLQLVHAPRIKA